MKLPKFLIYDNEILIGRVGFHRELLPLNFKMELIYGGGSWELNHDEKTVKLHGFSQEFGGFCIERAKSLPFEHSYFKDYVRIIDRVEYEN
jgi:hypothetical protein